MGFLSKMEINTGRSLTLVELRQRLRALEKKKQRAVFFTVSPNPGLSIIVKDGKKTRRISYHDITHKEQYEYLQGYVKANYVDLKEPEDFLFYVYETNKNNDLHVHGIMYVHDAWTQFDLDSIRKTVYSNILTQRNMNKRNSTKQTDYMNNIVYLDFDKIETTTEYLFKQTDIKLHYPDTWYPEANTDNNMDQAGLGPTINKPLVPVVHRTTTGTMDYLLGLKPLLPRVLASDRRERVGDETEL